MTNTSHSFSQKLHMKTIYSGVRMHLFQKIPSNAHCIYAKTVSIYLLCWHYKAHLKNIFISQITVIQRPNSFNLQQKELQGITQLAEYGPLLFQHFCIAKQIIIQILQWLLNNWLLSRNSCKGYNFSISMFISNLLSASIHGRMSYAARHYPDTKLLIT